MKHLLATTALAATVLAAPAFAETVLSGGTGVTLKLSGQVNRGVLFADDGETSDTYFVDNDNSSTRLKFSGEGKIDEHTKVGTVIEVQLESNSTADVNQIDGSTAEDELSQRKLEVYLHSDTFGRISLGQGSTASDGASGVDLSGTGVVGNSSVADLAGGTLFRTNDGDLTGLAVGDVFDNLDGLGRLDRVRYDSPEFAGLTLSASAAEEEQYDVALAYANEFGGLTLEAAVAYSENSDDDELVNGSLSLLHAASGVSLTLAGGQAELEDSDLEPQFGYIKLGYQTSELTSWGTTAVSVDYFEGEDVGADGDEPSSFGLQFVQNIDKVGTELYAGVRQYEYEAAGTDLDEVTALLVGARIQF